MPYRCIESLIHLGINLSTVLYTAYDASPSAAVNRALKKVSNMVYNFIYENVMNDAWFEYLLAKKASLRGRIFQMLLAQLEYMLINGQVNSFSGVNLAKGQTVELGYLRGRVKVADEVEQLANQPIDGLGYCLVYAGRTPSLSNDNYRKDY